MLVDTHNLKTAPELATLHNVHVRTVHNWRKDKTFPRPAVDKAGAVLWDQQEVAAWVQDRRHGGRKLEALREYRRTGRVRHTAAHVGVSPETVRRWMRAFNERLPRETWEDVHARREDANAG